MKKIVISFTLIAIIVIVWILRRYYFYCNSNLYFKESVDYQLRYYYGDKEIDCGKSDVERSKQGDLYCFIYSVELECDDVNFTAYNKMYDKSMLGGHLNRDDYFEVRDTYIRNIINAKNSGIKKYEIPIMESILDDKPDYVFVLDNNIDVITGYIKDILAFGINNNYRLDLWFEIVDKDGNKLTDSYAIMKACRSDKINYEGLDLFLDSLWN
ncbi:hypothetical protein SAMN04487829_2724 [Pseudobutyrivibrio sp. NOR37]|uniref:Uncharacterized protein n=1 Tax=Pseudobutyrivibrio xylanivorans TaxID=185007 RepID=A0A6M0LK64_PSEXY|nr:MULTISPECIES: hypothetical protein [Pseudobutyrivibrio]NEX02904.1 hypothetical protein [Pseudobutyrivibrio xylanivorans]SFR86427.1 hypothetical protein SAMN04487829_2724 [Pseudobutyrivibrio sp. NOR37]